MGAEGSQVRSVHQEADSGVEFRVQDIYLDVPQRSALAEERGSK